MSDSREAFEHWYAGYTGDPYIRHYCDSIGRYQFNSMQSAWEAWQAAHARYAGDGEETIQRLRGQLQNCVNHIERLKRHHPRETEKLEACVQSANKCLYETLHGINPPAQPKVPSSGLDAFIAEIQQDIKKGELQTADMYLQGLRIHLAAKPQVNQQLVEALLLFVQNSSVQNLVPVTCEIAEDALLSAGHNPTLSTTTDQ